MSSYSNTTTLSQREFIAADNQSVEVTKTRTKQEEPVGTSIYYQTMNTRKRTSFYIKLSIILIIINALLIVNAFSQAVTVNNVLISNTSQITVKGDMLNNNGATLNNNGTLEITGNLTNNSGSSLFGLSTGTVLLNGGAQQIAGSSSTGFNHLTIAGSGPKTLQQNISVGGNNAVPSGNLWLASQNLLLNSKQLTVRNPLPNAVTRVTGFLVSETTPVAGYGEVRWQIGTNTGNYVFPFGNDVSNSFLPVAFDITSAGNDPNGYLKVATYPTVTSATPNNRPLPTGLSSLMSTFGTENASNVADRWWVMDASSYATPPVSQLTLTYRDSEWDASNGSTNALAENLLKAQSSNGAVWTPVPMGIVNTTTNTVIINNVNSYNPFWTLAGSNGPLPIELLVFNAELNKRNIVDLDWATATEVNNDYFTIEKSADGISFEELGTVDGAGNSTEVLYYHTEDPAPFSGYTYYRLKQTDFDGHFTYSDIRAVRTEKVKYASFTVFPNPAIDHFYIKFDDGAIVDQLMITDMNGKVIRTLSTESGAQMKPGLMEVNRDGLAPGMYFLSSSDGYMQKLILQ